MTAVKVTTTYIAYGKITVKMKKRLFMRNRRGRARRSVGFSFVTILVASTLFGFISQLAQPHTVQAAPGSNLGENVKMYNILQSFRDRCVPLGSNQSSATYTDRTVLEDLYDQVNGDTDNGSFDGASRDSGASVKVGYINDRPNGGLVSCRAILTRVMNEVTDKGGVTAKIPAGEFTYKTAMNVLLSYLSVGGGNTVGLITADYKNFSDTAFWINDKEVRVTAAAWNSFVNNYIDWAARRYLAAIGSAPPADKQKMVANYLQYPLNYCFDWTDSDTGGSKISGNGLYGYQPNSFGANSDNERKTRLYDKVYGDNITRFYTANGEGSVIVGEDNTMVIRHSLRINTGNGAPNESSGGWYTFGAALHAFGLTQDYNTNGLIGCGDLRTLINSGGAASFVMDYLELNGNTGEIKLIDEAAPLPPNDEDGDSGDASNADCQIQGAIGWILNPICDIAINSTKEVSGLIENALVVKPLTQGTQSGTYQAWQVFRDLANALLVLVFLIVIFASVLPIELDPYAIKKTLPKLVAAVIGIQISFFVCQILVDITNVLGGGVGALISGVTENLNVPASGSATNPGTFIFTAITGVVIVAALIAPALLLLLAGLVAVVTMFITIQIRQMIIILLVVAAPVAILAWVLPNTEQYAKKWGQMFIKLLLMYPLIMFILKGADLVYVILASSAATGGDTSSLPLVQQIMINMIPIIALFMVPATFKAAGGIMGAVANSGFGRAGRLKGRAGGAFKSGYVEPIKGGVKNLAKSGGVKLLNADDSKTPGLGRLKRTTGRALTGTMFSVGKSGQRTRQALIDKLKAEKDQDNQAVLKEGISKNKEALELVRAAIRGDSTFKTASGKTIKLDPSMIESGVNYLASHGADLELGSLADDVLNADGTWKDEKVHQAVRDGIDRSGKASTVAASTPQLTDKTQKGLRDATAAGIVKFKNTTTPRAARVAFEDSTSAKRTINNLISITQSSALAGEFNPEAAQHYRARAETWLNDPANAAEASKLIDVGGGVTMSVKDYILHHIDADGNVSVNPDAKRIP